MFGNPENVGHDESSPKARNVYVYQKSHHQARNTRLNSTIYQNITIFILTAVRTSNLSLCFYVA
jgi:hypothetical protein